MCFGQTFVEAQSLLRRIHQQVYSKRQLISLLKRNLLENASVLGLLSNSYPVCIAVEILCRYGTYVTAGLWFVRDIQNLSQQLS
jgi:hypothetical protein